MPTPKVIIVYSATVVYIKNQVTKEYHYEDANQLSKDLARGKDRYRRWMDLGAATQQLSMATLKRQSQIAPFPRLSLKPVPQRSEYRHHSDCSSPIET